MTQPLRALRLARGLTQTELGRRAGVSAAHVSALEHGRQPATWGRLQRIADVCGVTTDAVLGRGAPPPALVDAVSAQDRQLLDAMQRHAENLLGPRVLKLAGGWRHLAMMGWCGDVARIRDGNLPRALPPAKTAAPEGWYTGWAPKRRVAR